MARVVVVKIKWRTQSTHPATIDPRGPGRTGRGGTLYYALTTPLGSEIWPRKRKNSSDVGESGDGFPSRDSIMDLNEIAVTR